MNDEKFQHKKSLGQNFLTSDIVPQWLCEASELQAGEQVFEIGPGTGALTKELLAREAVVTAVEADERALAILKELFEAEIKSGQLTLHHGDIRVITPFHLGFKNHDFKVVANIPYYLSGFLFRILLENAIQPKNLTFLIQKELAWRIARDSKESILSLSIKAFGEPKYIKTVSRGHFNPSPKVDSAILSVYNINRNHFSNFPPDHLFTLLHLGLGHKRKQLISNLSMSYDRTLLLTIFAELQLRPDSRGEDLSLPEWLVLAEKLYF